MYVSSFGIYLQVHNYLIIIKLRHMFRILSADYYLPSVTQFYRVCRRLIITITIISGVRLNPLGTAATTGPDDRWWWLWSNWWNEDWQGKPKYSEKTCPSATSSTTNPTLDPGSNPGRRGGEPPANRLSYGATYGSGFDYFHRRPASRSKRRKWKPVPGGTTGSPCPRGT
jgi:hypothetical protein